MYQEETLSEQVLQRLLDEIKRGTWEIGQHLNEKKIAETLHVSRTPVRWALKRIYETGLLDYDKNHGYRVRLITESDVQEIYKIRKALEILAFTEAARHMTDEDYEELLQLKNESREALEAEDVDRLMSVSLAFNKKAYEISRMPRLVRIQMDLQSVLWSFRTISFNAAASRRELAVEEQEEILNAMRKQQIDKLPALIEKHLERSEAYILEVLNDQKFNQVPFNQVPLGK